MPQNTIRLSETDMLNKIIEAELVNDLIHDQE
jgi:hypothetical protein